MDIHDPQFVKQVDPRAIEAWNALAEGNRAALDPLMARLRSHFPSFCGLMLRIRPKGGGWVKPFTFNQVQQRMWREIVRRIESGQEPWFVILKFRQAGMSTFWCAWLFWQIWRQNDVQAMVIAHQKQTAETMIETQRVFYEELPDAFKPDLREGNHGATVPRGEIYFADRRSWEMIHLAKNLDPRGQQVTHVLETEHAMYPNAEELNSALLPQLPTFGSEARLRSSVIIESTPKGENNFHELYTRAKKGKIQSFKSLFYPWFLFDNQYAAKTPADFRLSRDEKDVQRRLTELRMEYPAEDGGGKPVTKEQMYWRRETIATEMSDDEDRFDQEYPSDDITCWLLASQSVFKEYSKTLFAMVERSKERSKAAWADVEVDGRPVETKIVPRVSLHPTINRQGHLNRVEPNVTFSIDPHGPWMVWAPPVPGHKYVIGGDPAMGLRDGNPSVMNVTDVTAAWQVAEFSAQMGPEKFAIEMAAAGYWYNQALLVPEIVGVGYTLLVELLAKVFYPNMYRWPKWDEVNRYTHKRGFETNNRTKQLMVQWMIHHIEEQSIDISSRELLSELSTFEMIREDAIYTVFGAKKGCTDDRVMAFGLSLAGILQTPMLATEFTKAKSRMPSAQELHLASGPGDLRPTVLPKAIADRIHMRIDIPWNPISERWPA